MASSKGGIVIDWKQAMNSDPASEVEFFDSSSPVARHPKASLAVVDDDPVDDDGLEEEFAIFDDAKLQEKIKRWRCERGVLAGMPDGGEKMRIYVKRMEKELERRQVVRQRKDDTVRRQQSKLRGGSTDNTTTPDPYTFTCTDELSDNLSEKYLMSPHSALNVKTCPQAKEITFSEAKRNFSQDKHAYPNKNNRTAKTSATHLLKTAEPHPKSTAKSSNMYNYSIDRTRKRPLRSCNGRQKNNSAYSNESLNKLAEDSTLGSEIDKRSDWSRKKGSPYYKLKRDVVPVDVDDDTEPATLADIESSDKWDTSKAYYPSSIDPEAIELTHSDMKRLEPEEYLNSPIINFYIQYLKDSRRREDLYMFNTYFYCKLEEALSTMDDCDSQFRKLRRWWKSVDIFKKAYVILPINERMHWSLIIVCMPTNETETGPLMLHLDSLGLHRSRKLFDVVQRFLEAEWCYLKKDSSYDIPFSRKIWERLPRNIDKENVLVPRQPNEYDCGIFMLYYIDRFIQEAPESLAREDLCMFGCEWFQPKHASALREGIRALLFDVFQNAQGDHEPSLLEMQSSDHPDSDDKDLDVFRNAQGDDESSLLEMQSSDHPDVDDKDLDTDTIMLDDE